MKIDAVGIVGATGAVGKELTKLLETRDFPLKSLRCFASDRSKNAEVSFRGDTLPVIPLSEGSFEGLDLLFFCAGSAVSKAYARKAVSQGIVVIDTGSAFRLDPEVPLVIPEVNKESLESHKGLIAGPNCATVLLLTALAPLHRIAKLKRIVVSTYQAASGAGLRAMEELKEETLSRLQGTPYERTVIPHPYAFNLFLHNSPMQGTYSEEELKIIHETRKILQDSSIQIAPTCVRVPVLRSHAESINAEFHEPLSQETARLVLSNSPGITVLEDFSSNRFPMPIDAGGNLSVFCGRIREDLSRKNTLDLWVVGDQLLKGAAWNALQIAEEITLPSRSSASDTVLDSAR